MSTAPVAARRGRPFRMLAAAAAIACSALAQGDKLPKWRIDPYTKNDPAAMAAAGYVSFGPFPFGSIAADPVTTDRIDAAMEFVQILWIETRHFRIGVNLPTWSIPTELATRRKIRAELEELEKILPGVKSRTRRLDPWLRAHLTAYRLEKLYAETQELFGVTDADFPEDKSEVVIQPGARYMGYGPYLGMREKYLVLVFERLGPFQVYMEKYLGRPSKYPQRWHFADTSSILFTCATESDRFPLKHDTALHCALAFNVSQNLLDGFRYYAYDLPVWIREGFGHWNSRRIDPKWSNFDQNEGSVADMRVIEKWDVHCRNLLASTDKYAPFPEVAAWRDFGDISFNDHVMIWSRMDWLMSQGPERWRKFLFAVKGRVDEQWLPDQKDLVGATRDAIKEAYGLSFLNFDERWAEWVKQHYPTQ